VSCVRHFGKGATQKFEQVQIFSRREHFVTTL